MPSIDTKMNYIAYNIFIGNKNFDVVIQLERNRSVCLEKICLRGMTSIYLRKVTTGEIHNSEDRRIDKFIVYSALVTVKLRIVLKSYCKLLNKK